MQKNRVKALYQNWKSKSLKQVTGFAAFSGNVIIIIITFYRRIQKLS